MGKDGREGGRERTKKRAGREDGRRKGKPPAPLFTHTKVLRKRGLLSASMEAKEEG